MTSKCSLLMSERKVQTDSILARLKESYSFEAPYLERSALFIASLKHNFPLRLNSLLEDLGHPNEFLISLEEITGNEYPSQLAQLKNAIDKYHEYMDLFTKFTQEDFDLPAEYSWSLIVVFHPSIKKHSVNSDILDIFRNKGTQYKRLVKSMRNKTIGEIQEMYKDRLGAFEFDFTELVSSSVPNAPVKTSFLNLNNCQITSKRLINFDD